MVEAEDGAGEVGVEGAALDGRLDGAHEAEDLLHRQRLLLPPAAALQLQRPGLLGPIAAPVPVPTWTLYLSRPAVLSLGGNLWRAAAAARPWQTCVWAQLAALDRSQSIESRALSREVRGSLERSRGLAREGSHSPRGIKSRRRSRVASRSINCGRGFEFATQVTLGCPLLEALQSREWGGDWEVDGWNGVT